MTNAAVRVKSDAAGSRAGCKAALAIVAALALVSGLEAREPVDWVNTKIGTISHMLVPCFPAVQRPHGMMRFLPPNACFTTDRLQDFRLGVVSHRNRAGVMRMQPFLGVPDVHQRWCSTYDQQHVTPYRYDVWLDTFRIRVTCAPTPSCAVWSFDYETVGTRAVLLAPVSAKGTMTWNDGVLDCVDFFGGVPIYVRIDFDRPVVRVARREKDARCDFVFADDEKTVKMRVAFSFISPEQAADNLRRELPDFDLERVAAEGRAAWNATLGKIAVEGGSEDDRRVFYTALWRCHERMVDFTEAGRYRGWDGKDHDCDGARYFCDDWIWDTYRALHPLMTLLHPHDEGDRLTSYIRMAQQNPEGWMPTFPEQNGDAHCMNGFHTVAPFLDAWRKGVRNFDLRAAYAACAKTMRETTKTPWLRGPKNELDEFYDAHGYFPALHEGEPETVKGVSGWEKRQTVAVTLAASYDAWCLAELAHETGDAAGEAEFRAQASNYRKLWKSDAKFFHPKDKDGKWIEPFNYVFSGGIGSRAYYDENNAWTYLWDVQHAIDDLIALLGGADKFVERLDQMFNEPLGCRSFEWPGRQPDSSAMMGQFSMGNEPSFHIPYLYALAGHPAKTQKMIRRIREAWFRNDLMGVPGDEDGGAMSSFVVFSMLGFYPVTPGRPEYVLGSPVFTRAVVSLEGGAKLVLEAPNASGDAKYVRRVVVNGKDLAGVRFRHTDLAVGGKVFFEMSDRP